MELGAGRFGAVQPILVHVGLPPLFGMLAQVVAVHWRACAGAAQSALVPADVQRIPLGQNTLRDGSAAEHVLQSLRMPIGPMLTALVLLRWAFLVSLAVGQQKNNRKLRIWA